MFLKAIPGRRSELASLLNEGQSLSGLRSATSPTDAVDVVFVGVGQIIIDNVSNVRNINSTSGDVGRNENTYSLLLKKSERDPSFPLALVPVNGGRLKPSRRELDGNLFHTALRFSENQNLAKLLSQEQVVEYVYFFFMAIKPYDVLVNVVRSLAGFSFNPYGIV